MQIKYSVKNYFSVFKHTAIGINFFVWLRALAKNKFKIGWPFWPKAVFITVLSLVNLPFLWVEKLVYQRKIKSTKVKAPIFILGHPRSGTTFLQYIFSRDPNLAFCSTTDGLAPNTMLLFGTMAENIMRIFMPKTRPQDNVRVAANTPLEEEFALGNMSAASFVHGYYFPQNIKACFAENVIGTENSALNAWKKDLHYLLQKLTLKNKGKRLVLKSPLNTGRLAQIQALYPDAVFVHIHRNPYAVFQSNQKLYESILPLLALQKVTPAEMEEFIFDAYEKMHNQFFMQKKSLAKNKLAEVSYADFIKQPIAHLELIYAQLNIPHFAEARPFFEKELTHFENYKTNAHVNLPAHQIARINKQWRFFFEEYNYDLQKV